MCLLSLVYTLTQNAMTTTRKTALSRIMKAAWTIYRKSQKTFSQALKAAWALVKNDKGNSACGVQVREVKRTEKAVQVSMRVVGWVSAVHVWMPLSQVSITKTSGCFSWMEAPQWLLDKKAGELGARFGFEDLV